MTTVFTATPRQVKDNKDVTIIDCVGSLTLGGGASTLRQAIQKEEDKKEPMNLILNLARITAFDSSGFGEFMNAFASVSRNGGNLVLLDPPKHLTDVLEMTRVATILPIFRNEAKAIRSFGASRAEAVQTHQVLINAL